MYLILDTETTGMSKNDEIVEMGIIDMKENVLYESTFRPQTKMNPFASRVNHITDESLKDAPLFADEWDRILSIINGNVILGHNIKFDVRLMKQTAARYNLTGARFKAVDTVAMMKRKIQRPSYSIDKLAQEFGLGNEEHRAASDCLMTLEILRKLDIA